MRTFPGARRIAPYVAVFLLLPWISLQGQVSAVRSAGAIQSLTEPDESLAVRSSSAKTGLVTFASTPGRGLLVRQPATASAEERALSFVDLYGSRFGIAGRAQLELQRAAPKDEVGLEHVRFQQLHRGIPVMGGELIVHMNGARVTAANGLIVNDLPADVTPGVSPAAARAAARAAIAKYKPGLEADAQYSSPRLQVFNRGVMAEGVYPSQLAWFVEATGPVLREFMWIDAHTGSLLFTFSQLTEAKNRSIYTASNGTMLPGTLHRTEGQPPPSADADETNAYDFAGITYDYYITNHGRDSFDNAGGLIVSTVHYGFNFSNAFWNGVQMVYGDGFASADDAVGHELTHAVTERTAGLYYYNQSGALNESFSDIMGETIDLTDGVGNDTPEVRWQIGEDLPIGAIRDMMDPTTHSDPGKMSDSLYFRCSSQAWTNPNADSGGVHTNSGVPNHAYALMVDGGTYNSQTIRGIGLTKAAKIEYRALTTYLVSGSGFLDDFNALNQSCADLIGTVGITAADCVEVNKALLAVEMNAAWGCAGAAPVPVMCPAGGPPVFTFQDTFEATTSNWTASTATPAPPAPAMAGGWTARETGFARSGLSMAYGTDVDNPSDHSLAMSSSVLVPSAGRVYFDSAFEFENSGPNYYDGGVVEYSTDGGATWVDAGSLIDAGRTYAGAIANGSGNPLAGRSAFVGTSYGYTGTRLDLSSLAGHSVRFRFRIGTDAAGDSLGWAVDNFGIYSCPPAPPSPPSITVNPAGLTTAAIGQTVTFSSSASGSPAPTAQWQVSVDAGATWSDVPAATTPTLSFAAQLADNGKQYRVLYSNASGTAASSAAALFVRRRVRTDLDNDGKADLAVWRPGNGFWFWLNSSGSYDVAAAGSKQWGNSGLGDVPISGDMDGDGIMDLVIWRASTGTWYWLTSSSGYTTITSRQWGNQAQGDVPMLGDIDGDGQAELIVWRATTGTWFWLTSGSGYDYGSAGQKQWGNASLGDQPMIGDHDGDGLADLTVWRASTGTWFWLTSRSGYSYASSVAEQWGNGSLGDVPLIADMDGDGRSDLVVWRPGTGTYYWLSAASGYDTNAARARQWGNQSLGDIPMLGDIDGDGLADLVVWRASTGTWFWLSSTTGYSYASQGQKQWGASGDIPMIK